MQLERLVRKEIEKQVQAALRQVSYEVEDLRQAAMNVKQEMEVVREEMEELRNGLHYVASETNVEGELDALARRVDTVEADGLDLATDLEQLTREVTVLKKRREAEKA
jgi:predicted  nucleic acid-binding Zn-ribbon protein